MASLSEFMAEWHNGLPYIEAHTSGSTGAPKPIRLLKSDMLASARATNDFFGINSGSTLACPLSFDYIAGKMMAVRAIAAGCALRELPVSSTVEIDAPADLLPVVPMQLPSLLAQPKAPAMINNLLIGGAPLDGQMEAQIADAGFHAWLGYGMTETCSHVALRMVGGDGVFHAMKGIGFDTYSRGCLAISSGNFSWKTLITNDIVELLSSKSFRWLGRYDNVIISGGLKIHPEVMERGIKALLPELPDFYIIGEPHPVLGECAVMVVENAPEGLADKLKALIPDGKSRPRKVYDALRLVRTESGKIKRLQPNLLILRS